VRDADCVELLRWALPRLGLRWEGFRRVRRQVCRRVARRIEALGLAGAAAYRSRLESHPEEWSVFETFCRIPISRFYRDRGVFDGLRRVVLPALVERAEARGDRRLRAWSAGCASGEEAWTLLACFASDLAASHPALGFELVATDVEEHLLERARSARYAPSSTRELPAELRQLLFAPEERALVVQDRHRAAIRWRLQDLRREAPEGRFDLVLCRNVAFTYFDAEAQREVLARIAACLRPGGALVIGRHERLPQDEVGFAPWPGAPCVYERGAGALEGPRGWGRATRRAPICPAPAAAAAHSEPGGWARRLQRLRGMSVGALCVREVQVASPDESVAAVAKRMAAADVGTVVVLGPERKPLGMLTDRDIALRCVAQGRDPETTAVAALMSAPARCVHESTPIESALARMASVPARRLVVVDDAEQLVGILALDDILELLAEEAASVGRLLAGRRRRS
jgi:chemotaxis protein methyltransferase CheR